MERRARLASAWRSAALKGRGMPERPAKSDARMRTQDVEAHRAAAEEPTHRTSRADSEG